MPACKQNLNPSAPPSTTERQVEVALFHGPIKRLKCMPRARASAVALKSSLPCSRSRASDHNGSSRCRGPGTLRRDRCLFSMTATAAAPSSWRSHLPRPQRSYDSSSGPSSLLRMSARFVSRSAVQPAKRFLLPVDNCSDTSTDSYKGLCELLRRVTFNRDMPSSCDDMTR
jgi:hypothetical protein